MTLLWARGKTLGSGAHGVVSMAAVFTGEEAYICAVKSSSIQYSSSLNHENLILTRLGDDCPHTIFRLDHEITLYENGAQIYNLFLPYMPGGTLSDHLQRYDDAHKLSCGQVGTWPTLYVKPDSQSMLRRALSNLAKLELSATTVCLQIAIKRIASFPLIL